MSKEVNDGDLNPHAQKTEIKHLVRRVDDFETRIRILETYKSKQEGGWRAHRQWIGYGCLILIQIVILFFKDWRN